MHGVSEKHVVLQHIQLCCLQSSRCDTCSLSACHNTHTAEANAVYVAHQLYGIQSRNCVLTKLTELQGRAPPRVFIHPHLICRFCSAKAAETLAADVHPEVFAAAQTLTAQPS